MHLSTNWQTRDIENGDEVLVLVDFIRRDLALGDLTEYAHRKLPPAFIIHKNEAECNRSRGQKNLSIGGFVCYN
jgi:hypothetical protein